MANAIRIVGQSGHSSDPARGVNAIDLMHESIGRLMELRKTRKSATTIRRSPCLIPP